MARKYKIYFIIIDARSIYNYVGPWDWLDNNARKEKRSHIYNNKKDWYDKLEIDISEVGVKNPILITNLLPKNDYGAIPDYGKKLGLFCSILGGSRLFCAQKLGIQIPCIISDFKNEYAHMEEISHPNEIKSLFNDPPKNFSFSRWGLDIR